MPEAQTEEFKKRLILLELRKKMKEVERLQDALGENHIPNGASPHDARELIEEIEVPDLKVLKDQKTEPKKNKPLAEA